MNNKRLTLVDHHQVFSNWTTAYLWSTVKLPFRFDEPRKAATRMYDVALIETLFYVYYKIGFRKTSRKQFIWDSLGVETQLVKECSETPCEVIWRTSLSSGF
ncbi:hypothetical protein B9Q09_03070 [Candidatus Marsarchaeota G2 archaeon ECH_B_SAG-C16]|jgi:hypothetical protein|uniref:Uncharacterized protein n=5 Tax=Candidatus Marsarchaeota group 2 TaxID=2203771 RepID=A0A2R6B8G5_9ARCH|nr:MAG: hypothetical protein B9Q08_00515 [Candidatus Marsarchaeota G2 archaeon ECH_B_SAG-M15]PSN94923.1 MAG: hypothetical protein B9Q06_07510 [Candidatus Marsarchaeota G2 archaeon ECH_B_2]PSN95438.1 MAG: hypothetical protein B9Q09_03070 [Candidatus Marsarchaeota G2 archaeon ECH_B_SAG-C16]PSN99435.1 MAG: hypothetical protein B9Q07_06980 [Candidatus Marsarchaeota G2 archaeon ECH_B_3]PSO01697.1 MAG: hypothetical protein B9Q05_07755 [Candidatus Marsarchaeota G2 archaeon ECH_B_1]